MDRLKFISVEQLLEMKENGDKFVLAAAQSPESYAEGRIPGAIHLLKTNVEQDAPAKLKKDDVIVTYCGGYACESSTNAARKLMAMGYKHVMVYKGGRKGWIAAGLELET